MSKRNQRRAAARAIINRNRTEPSDGFGILVGLMACSILGPVLMLTAMFA